VVEGSPVAVCVRCLGLRGALAACCGGKGSRQAIAGNRAQSARRRHRKRFIGMAICPCLAFVGLVLWEWGAGAMCSRSGAMHWHGRSAPEGRLLGGAGVGNHLRVPHRLLCVKGVGNAEGLGAVPFPNCRLLLQSAR
jgi:hypothetical protein